ncbi:MAG: NifB/NifX family molybdenum-iron cluster-binding protein [Candidatus Thorarchaeota archaeon]
MAEEPDLQWDMVVGLKEALDRLRRIVIPSDDQQGKKLGAHFGRAPYLVLVEIDDSKGEVKTSVHENRSSHLGGHGFTHDNVMQMRPDAVIVSGIGPRGLELFRRAGISVLQARSTSIEEIISAYMSGSLNAVTEGCHEAHHR